MPRVILIATGSEVSLALEARETLEGEGIPTRVVSMPSWELFDRQPREYRDAVLPPEIRARLSIEAGVSLGWKRYVGDDGDSIGLDRYGASAPGEIVLKELGFNVENVVRWRRPCCEDRGRVRSRGFRDEEGDPRAARSVGHAVDDIGTFSTAPSDYPDFARKVREAVLSGGCERGIVVCGSGVGASVAANKVPGMRAALCHDTFSARQGVEDDDMNVLCLGARVIGPSLAAEVLKAFLGARFSGLERHVRRVGKIRKIEEDARQGIFDSYQGRT